MESEMGNMSEKLEAMRNSATEDGGQFPKKMKLNLWILWVWLTFNDVFFFYKRNFNFFDFLTLREKQSISFSLQIKSENRWEVKWKI